jgi:AP-1 complex subunit beta-1
VDYLEQVWLTAVKGKGLEILGTFSRKNNQVIMELTLNNKAMQAMSGFAIQLNKNRSLRCEHCVCIHI